MSGAELLDQVRDMRRRGLSPKQIARELGMRPAEVAPLIRQVGTTYRTPVHRPLAEPADRELVACWINPGWSSELLVQDGTPWTEDPAEGSADRGAAGLVMVTVARAERSSRVTVCNFLIDVFCLGVKNASGPETMSSSAADGYVRRFYGAFADPPRPAPLELAQHLVHGGIEYARSLGFEPHPDYAAAAPYLGGPPPGPCPITFGRLGKPFYVSGPYDDPGAVMTTLAGSVGAGNFNMITRL